MIKIWRDREWLWKHYTVQEESMYAMAKEAECSRHAIYYWLCKMGMPIRVAPHYKIDSLWRNRDWLYEHYIVREESILTMAKGAGCSDKTIHNWLHKKGIPVRSSGEGAFLANRNFLTLSPKLLKWLRGELLGDGCISMHGSRSALYSHGSKYEKYLIWLSGCLDKLGIEQVGQINRYKSKQNGAIAYYYQSKSYPELVPFVKEWYAERDGKMKKTTVPKDLELTPIMARQWYIGDGHLRHNERGRPSISLGTYDFDKESVEYLVSELCKLGFKATRWPSNNCIGLSVHSVKDFLSWIGPCPISCYDYKWDYSS